MTIDSPAILEDVLRERACKILKGNWIEKYGVTIPSHKLYPYQWSWDSGFIAIGNSYVNIGRAMAEIQHLFSAQWKNGMVPHVVFYEPSDTYWPKPSYYHIERTGNSPRNILTSGMTQPPVHAISCYYIYRQAIAGSNNNSNYDGGIANGKIRDFLSRVVPKIQHFHRYLMTERDPERSGLATIVHPWESGMDDSPAWDDIISRIVEENSGRLPRYVRKDVEAIDNREGERPIKETYQTFIFLINLMRECNYDESLIYRESPFKVKDVVFNSIFYVANLCILELATLIGEKDDNLEEIRQWLKLQRSGFDNILKSSVLETVQGYTGDKLSATAYYNYDLIRREKIRKPTCSCIVPIFTGIPSEKESENLVNMIHGEGFCGTGKCTSKLVPSYALGEPGFESDRYWRGPMWININWMIYQGLLFYGYGTEANLLRNEILSLVAKNGFREYYHPFTGKGLGGESFSWSAALVLDLLHNSGKPILPVSMGNGQ